MKTLIEKILGLISKFLAAKEKRKEKKSRTKIPYVAICVGHSRDGDNGARSVSGVHEWAYNKVVADLLRTQLKQRGINSIVLSDYNAATYSEAMKWVADRIKKEKCDIAVELHFNSYHSTVAEGYEYLYYSGSEKGKRLAECFLRSHSNVSNVQKNRGVKEIEKGGRGSLFLKSVKPPAVICEPFFGSSPKEWVLLGSKHAVIADIYAEAIANYFAA